MVMAMKTSNNDNNYSNRDNNDDINDYDNVNDRNDNDDGCKRYEDKDNANNNAYIHTHIFSYICAFPLKKNKKFTGERTFDRSEFWDFWLCTNSLMVFVDWFPYFHKYVRSYVRIRAAFMHMQICCITHPCLEMYTIHGILRST